MKVLETNKIYQGHALDVLKTFPDESIDCVMTSPPYWSLRDYGEDTSAIWDGDSKCEHEFETELHKTNLQAGNPEFKRPWREEASGESKIGFCLKCGAWKGQLGLEPNFNDYIRHLCDIFDEVKRVLRKDGTCWVNLGDTYSSLGKVGGDFGQDGKITKGYSGRGRIEKDTYPEKSLVMIPFRFAIEMVNRGWILRNTLIWHKPNCLPSSAKDRFTVDFEYLFFFTKNKKYWFETQYEPLHTPYEQLIKDNRGLDNEKYKEYSVSNRHGGNKTIGETMNPLGRNKRTVWSICPRPFKEAHFAVFPEKLCETPIKAGCPEFICKKCGKPREKILVDVGEKTWTDTRGEGSKDSFSVGTRGLAFGRTAQIENRGYTDCGCNAGFEGGVVLDPFIGSGTVGLVALKQNKKFVGIELKPAYIEMAMKRLKPWLEQTRLGEFSDPQEERYI